MISDVYFYSTTLAAVLDEELSLISKQNSNVPECYKWDSTDYQA